MVEVGKIGAETLVLNGHYISIFREGKLVWRKAYRGYTLPDGNFYMYRRRVRITELSGKTLANYQIRIEIGADDPIWEHARSAGEDIRFCYRPEEVMIPYWIEKYDLVKREAVIWVRVPGIPANSEVEIYMYYGNPEVASASDGEATFEFFDDFEGEDLDASKWEVVSGTAYQVANGLLKITNNDVRIQSKTIFSEGVALECKTKVVSVSENGFTLCGFYVDTSNGIVYHKDSPSDYIFNDGSYSALREEKICTDVWHKLIFAAFYNGTSHTVNIKAIRLDTGAIVYQDDWSNTVSDEKIMLSKRADDRYTGQSYEAYWDWILVRKYTEPEPSVGVGVEE